MKAPFGPKAPNPYRQERGKGVPRKRKGKRYAALLWWVQRHGAPIRLNLPDFGF